MRISYLITFLTVCFVLSFLPTGFTQSASQPQAVETESVELLGEEATLIENCVLPSVKVVTDRGRGSGTIINDRYILTACHVINDATEISILLQPEMESYPCRVVTKGDMGALDYAILEVVPEDESTDGVILPQQQTEDEEEFKFEHFAKLISPEAFNELCTGEEVTAVGYPLGGELHITDGRLCSASDGFYSTSACVIYGNSGGGMFVEHELMGVVVRIAISGFSPISHVSFIVPIDSIRADIHEKGLDCIWEGQPVPEPEEEAIPEEGEEEESEEEEDISSDDIFLEIGGFNTIPLERMFSIPRN